MMVVPADQPPRVSAAQYEAIRAKETASCAVLARKWGVEAVGRDYPYLSRAGPAVAGEWYVIRNGARRRATPAQSRILDDVGYYGVHAIGPVYVSVASDVPDQPRPGQLERLSQFGL